MGKIQDLIKKKGTCYGPHGVITIIAADNMKNICSNVKQKGPKL